MRRRGRETRILRFRLHTAAKKYAEHGCRYTAAFYGRKSLETNIHIYSEAVCPAIRPTPSAAAGNPFKRQQRGFLSVPPAYPVRLPSAPSTRWQGIISEIGLRPTAPPHRARRHTAETRRDPAIGRRAAIRKLAQQRPNGTSKRRSAKRCQRRRRPGVLAAEIAVQPAHGVLKHRQRLFGAAGRQCSAEMPLSVEPQPTDGPPVARQRNAAERRLIMRKIRIMPTTSFRAAKASSF